MLNSPNRDGGGPGHLSRRVFRQSLYSDLEVRKRAALGYNRKCFTVTLPKCILLWAPSKKQLNLGERHRKHLIWRPQSGWYAPAAREEPRAASHPKARACRSRFRIGGRSEERRVGKECRS